MISPSQVSFTLDANAQMAVNINGNTVFSFQVSGGLQISNAGVAAALSMNFASGFTLPSSLGFGLNATFLLELNTTNAPVAFPIADITVPVDPSGHNLFAEIQGTGDLTMLGGAVDLRGTFDITVNSYEPDGQRGCHADLARGHFHRGRICRHLLRQQSGLVVDIALSLPGGAQGIAPIPRLGDNFVISGAFDLELNTCSVARRPGP